MRPSKFFLGVQIIIPNTKPPFGGLVFDSERNKPNSVYFNDQKVAERDNHLSGNDIAVGLKRSNFSKHPLSHKATDGHSAELALR